MASVFLMPVLFFTISYLNLFLMARIVYGAIATEIRGSIGGTTFQGNAYGFTIKNKANMARLQSVAQNEKHRLVTLVSQFWFALTQAKRDHWTAFALAHPVASKHNPAAVLNGYTYFLKYNMIRAQGGVVVLDEPTDGTLTLPPMAPALSLSGGSLWWNIASDAFYADWAYNVYLSPPMRASQSYNASKTRYVENGNFANSNVDVSAPYLSFFGALPAIGDIIFCEVQPWGQYTPAIPQSSYFVLVVS
jgi:hypothetical protein